MLVVYSLFGKDGILLAELCLSRRRPDDGADILLAATSAGNGWGPSRPCRFYVAGRPQRRFRRAAGGADGRTAQGLIDAGTCLVVYRIAWDIAPSFALPAAIAACINPTQTS